MSKNLWLQGIDLQLFAEGGSGEGGTGASSGAENGVSAGVPGLQQKTGSNPLADVKYGIQEGPAAGGQEPDVASPTREQQFEALIKGEYKDLYDQRVSDTVQRRLKNTKEAADKYDAVTPLLAMLGQKYGVDYADAESLRQAIEDDDSFYEEEALEKGITVDQLKQIRKMERENADLRRQMQEQNVRENADRIYAGWMDQASALKAVYPNFDLSSELQNSSFADLLRNGIDVRTAYEVVHKDEIIAAAMQFTAQQVAQKTTNNIIANGARPAENGASPQSSAVVKSDVSQLTKADRQEIARRVARGERISF